MYHRHIRQRITGNRVFLIGTLLGFLSLVTGWLTIRPNRIASGIHLSTPESLGWAGTGLLFLLWVFILMLSLQKQGKRNYYVMLGLLADIVFIAGILLTGLNASRLTDSSNPFTRISLGAGFWLMLAGIYVVLFGMRQILKQVPIWRNAVLLIPLLFLILITAAGLLNDLSIMQEFFGREQRFFQELFRHLQLFGISTILGTVLGISLGIWATRSNRAAQPIFYLASITQTIPSLALFGLLIAPLSALSFSYPALRELGIRGVGMAPAFIALVIYSLLPIVRNTFAGIRQLDTAVLDAGRGMGMSKIQLFIKIEVPLAFPLILEGVRIAAVQSVGLTAVAALIGAGGLGWFIFQGMGQAAVDLILLGAIPIIILALIVDGIMRLFIRIATPKAFLEGATV